MRTTPLHVPTSLALLERGLDSSSGLGFVRERLALLGKTLFLVSFGFYLFLLASLTLVGGAPFLAVVRGPVALGHLCASLNMAVLWLLVSRARLSLWSLGALDAVSFVVAGTFPVPHDGGGRRPDPSGAAGPDGHRHGPRHPDAVPARADHPAVGPRLRPDRRRVHRVPSPHDDPARLQPGLPEAAHDAQHRALERPGNHAGDDRLARPLRPPAGRSPRRPSWDNTCSRRRSVEGEWARSGARAIAC